jgi:acetyl-CoA C-acetyltransferase
MPEPLGAKPLACFVASGSAGVDPDYVVLGPIPATLKALTRAGLTVGDLPLVAINDEVRFVPDGALS